MRRAWQAAGCAMLLAFGGLPALDATAATLWRVEGETNTVYLLGSVHLLRESDYPLPAEIDEAYADAETLVMELDMDDLDPLLLQSAVTRLGVAADGRTLAETLGPQRHARASALAEELDIPLELLDSTEPWLAAITVEQMILARIGFNPMFGIEAHLAGRAAADGKEILGLEGVEEQLAFLDGLSADAQADLLLQTLEDGAAIEDLMDDLIAAWRRGDVAMMEDAMLDDMAAHAELYEAVVVTRNRNWTRRIEDMLDDDDDYLVVVGALHLIGEHGLPTLLEAAGHRATRR